LNERVAKLRESIEKDDQRITKLQDGIKAKREKITELEQTELLHNLNSICAQGMAVNDIVEAIKNNDCDTLLSLMSPAIQKETKSGTSSAFSTTKEELTNE